MSTVTIEVTGEERDTMIGALAREALQDLGNLKRHLVDLTVNAIPTESLVADCVASARLVISDLEAFRRVATASEEER